LLKRVTNTKKDARKSSSEARKRKTREALGKTREALEFLAVTAAVGVMVYAILSLPPFENALAWLAAESSRVFLTTAGVNAQVVWSETVSSGTPTGMQRLTPRLIGVNAQGVAFDAELVELCWGKLELALLAGFIAASRDRSRRERLNGIAAGAAVMLLAFNPLRVSVSLFAINAFVHDVLFRFFLIATLAFYYALWYAWLSLPSKIKIK